MRPLHNGVYRFSLKAVYCMLFEIAHPKCSSKYSICCDLENYQLEVTVVFLVKPTAPNWNRCAQPHLVRSELSSSCLKWVVFCEPLGALQPMLWEMLLYGSSSAVFIHLPTLSQAFFFCEYCCSICPLCFEIKRESFLFSVLHLEVLSYSNDTSVPLWIRSAVEKKTGVGGTTTTSSKTVIIP